MKAFMQNDGDAQRFDRLFLPHLDAAHNLARWLTRDAAAAQDVVQESCLRAFAALKRFDGEKPRAWFLAIVRNQSYTWLRQKAGQTFIDIDDETAFGDKDQAALQDKDTPETLLRRMEDEQALQNAMEALPPGFREVIVLKEQEDMSYKEIAAVLDVPIGTVMSRLARGRALLKRELLR